MDSPAAKSFTYTKPSPAIDEAIQEIRSVLKQLTFSDAINVLVNSIAMYLVANTPKKEWGAWIEVLRHDIAIALKAALERKVDGWDWYGDQ